MEKKSIKTKTFIIPLILILTISTMLVAFPAATAQPGTTWPTFAVCSLIPDVTGVNQQVLISMGITRQTAWPQPGWYGLTVTVTKPDGTSETLGPIRTDTTGLTGSAYTPSQVGTYTFVVNYPQQEIEVGVAGVETGTTMLASQSAPAELTVTAEPQPFFPGAAPPTEYWTRPIDAQNREWFQVAGSWLDGSYMRSVNQRYAPNNDAPDTAHMLWDKPYAQGGLAGGERGWNSFNSGDAYEGKWQNPVIVAGILVSNRYTRGSNEAFAINIRTGEELWSKDIGDKIDFGQVFYWDTFNMHGCWAYVWSTQGSTWRAWDPFTGRNEYNMTGVPGGNRVPGPNGEIMRYSISTGSARMTIWNSTAAFYQMQVASEPGNPQAIYHAGRWRPQGREFDAGFGIQWNGSIPSGLPGGVEVVIPLERAIGSNTDWAGGPAVQNPQFWAINLKPGHEGELIFNEAWPIPQAGTHVDFTGTHPYSVDYDVFVVTAKETRKHYGISMTTGQQLWATTAFEPYNNAYSNVYFDPWGQAVCAEGKLITAGFGGVITAYSLVDGSLVWQYEMGNEYGEFLFGNDWSSPTGFISDGKVYLMHTEHSVINPMPRGAPTVCISLATGEQVWRADGLRLGTRWGGQPIIGDSVIVGFGSYDNTINAIGKGPSELTVSGPDASVALGNEVLVTGTVMDVSPGTKDIEQTSRFPNGVPAVRDAEMSQYMLYVYKDRPVPTTTGVAVKIEAVDPNGNYQDLGTTTSDMYGNFGFAFEPETEGTYMIMATFAGSGAYYGAMSTTYTQVGAASPTTPIEPDQPDPETPVAPLITTEIAIIAAIVIAAIIGIAAFWALKRK
jgi:hypothetical protein